MGLDKGSMNRESESSCRFLGSLGQCDYVTLIRRQSSTCQGSSKINFPMCCAAEGRRKQTKKKGTLMRGKSHKSVTLQPAIIFLVMALSDRQRFFH